MPAGHDRAPPPMYQSATEGSRYGFRLPGSETQYEWDDGAISAHLDSGTAPPSHIPVPPSSHNITPASCDTPMFCGGTSTRGISTASSIHRGFIAPSSRRGSTTPISRSGSACHDCDIPPHPVHPQSCLHTALFALNSPHPNLIHIQTLSPLSLPSHALCSICDAYVSVHNAMLLPSDSREHR